jgi:hypothetical protein
VAQAPRMLQASQSHAARHELNTLQPFPRST